MSAADAPADLFEEGMLLLTENYDKELTPGLSRIYRIALREVSHEAFLDAVGQLLGESKFFPRPAEILAVVRARQSADERDAESRQRLKRSALLNGFVPANWDAARLTRERAALGLPAAAPALGGGE